MSKEADTREKPAKPVRRIGIGGLSLVQIVCATTIYLAVNYLASQHWTRRDLSGDAAYTLSLATRNLLESPLIQDRQEPIKVLVAFRTSANFYHRIRSVAEQYELLSGGKIKVELLDPVRSPDATIAKAEEYGDVFTATRNRRMFTRNLVVIDARGPGEAIGTVESGQEGMLPSPHIRFIEDEEMIHYETIQDAAGNSQRKPKGFLGEDVLTSGLLAAIEGKPRPVYFIADKSGLPQGGSGTAWANFAGTLLTRNAPPIRVNLADLDRIPDDAAAVAIAGPVYDLSPTELDVLKEYWSRPRSALLVTAGSNEAPPRLRAFLREHGVTLNRDRVVTRKGDQITTNVHAVFTEGMAFTREFGGKSTLLEGATCSLGIRDTNNDDLISRGINLYTLLETGSEYWGETAFDKGSPAFDSREDIAGPLRLAAAVIRGVATDDQLAGEVSRMVVIGNTDFLDPNHFSDINRDFLATSVDWLIGRESVSGFGPRTFGTYKLPLLDVQVSFINRVNLIFLPAFALLAGALVWSSRRA